jgi:hypothetical protein
MKNCRFLKNIYAKQLANDDAPKAIDDGPRRDGDIIRNKDANRRIVKWAMELCPYSIEFQGRMSIKSQTLADFIVEWTDLSVPPD